MEKGKSGPASGPARRGGRTRRPKPASGHPVGVRSKFVLVVEDEPGLQQIVLTVLREAGFEAKAVGSGEEAVAFLTDITADAVVVDIFMPGKGGLWAIQQIRARQPGVKIVAVSGGWRSLAPGEAVAAANKVGADRGLAKPFDVDELTATVVDLVGPPLEIDVSPMGRS